jgi:hypothetical protein
MNTDIERKKEIFETVSAVNLSKVRSADRKNVRSILAEIIAFDEAIPEFDYSFSRKETHYVVEIRGWCSTFDLGKFTKRYLSAQRKPLLDDVIKGLCTASPASGRGPIIALWIARDRWRGTTPYKPAPLDFERKRDIADLVNAIKLPNIDQNDRESVRAVLFAIISFDDIMPKLDFSFSKKETYYDVNIRGWSSSFDMDRFDKTFLSAERDRRLDNVMKCTCSPTTASGRGSILTLSVVRTKWESTTAPRQKKR